MKNHEPAGAAPSKLSAALPPARGQGVAITALVFGIVAFLIGIVPLFGAAIGAGAIAFGILAARRGRGSGKWVTGIALGSVAVVTSIAVTVVLVINAPSTMSNRAAQEQSAPQAEEPAATAAPDEHSAEPVVVEPTPDPVEPAAIREYWPLRNDLRIPQFIGMNLSEAREAAKRAGVHLSEDDDRDNRIIWIASNWTVISQGTPAGADENENTIVRVRVLKHDEVDRNQIAIDKVDTHRDERMFTGRVTGYPRQDTGDSAAVSVDGAQLSLDMVSPLARGCAGPRDVGQDAALAELEKNLPIGQRVLVVMSEQRKDDAFVHVLDETSNDPAVPPPGDSVNERLVRSGWWVPDVWTVEGGVGVTGYGEQSVAYEPYTLRQSPASQAAAYAPLIVAASNDALNNYVGTIGDCRRAAEAEREISIAQWRENERERDRLIAEAEWRARQPVYCRDGDGDGICFEGRN